jgi:hypothetical protein
MNYLYVAFFCIYLNAVSPNRNLLPQKSSFADLEFCTNLPIELSEESKKNLQVFVKSELIKNSRIPETASINIESIYLERNHRDLFAGQRYIVKSLVTWTAFFPHKCKVGLYILKMNKHNEYFTTQLFDSNLIEAKVDLPK